MGHLGLELAHPQAIQNQGQGLVEANQIHLAKGLARPWQKPGRIQPGLTMTVQAPAADSKIAMALLELPPGTQVGAQNPRIAPGGGGAQGIGSAQRCRTDQHHRQAPLGKLQGHKPPGQPPPNDGDVTRAALMGHLKPAG